MTALRAHPQRRKSDALADPGDPAPVEADVIPMIGHEWTTAEQVSTPIPVMADNGTCLMAGLTWEIASGPETPVVRPDAPLVLRLPERRARLAPLDIGAASSLLLAMGEAVARARPDASGPRAFLAELHGPESDPLFWLGFADLVVPNEDAADTSATSIVPRPGAEQLFSDPDAALAALQKHLSTAEIAGVGTLRLAGEDGSRVRQSLDHIALTLPVEEIEPDALSGDLPRFRPPRRVPVKFLGGLGAGTAVVLAAVFLVPPVIETWFETPPPPPPEMVSVRVEQRAFARVCSTALDAWWPRVVGWQLDSAGCALAGHLPNAPALPDLPVPARLLHPMVSWHHLTPAPDSNAVLAQSTAERMIGTWPHEAQLTADGLTFWQVTSLPLVPVGDGDMTPPESRFDPDVIRARLAALWANAPEAVTGDGRSFTVTPGSGLSPTELFDRAGRVPGIAPVRLVRGNGETDEDNRLVLVPVTSRTVPVTMIGEGEESSPDNGRASQ